jgi:nucleolar protein 4
LAKEGLVYPNSYEAAGVSKVDMQMRQKIEASNTQKLKLLHYFVSPTRLSVHNIPIKCTDQQLREIFQKAVGEEARTSGRLTSIVECRIMRDLSRVNSEGVAKSKGFGFVEFKNHEMAKKALHATNNNPELFKGTSLGKGVRLIVQFSIEDMRALKKKKERAEKARMKQKGPYT